MFSFCLLVLLPVPLVAAAANLVYRIDSAVNALALSAPAGVVLMNEKIGDSTQFWVGKKTGNDDSTTFSPINSPEVFLDTDNGGQLVLSRNPVPWKLQDVKTGNFFFGVDLYQFLNVPLDKPLRYNNATNKLTVENPPQGELRDEFLWFARQINPADEEREAHQSTVINHPAATDTVPRIRRDHFKRLINKA